MEYLKTNNVMLAHNSVKAWSIYSGEIKNFEVKSNQEVFDNLIGMSDKSTKEAFENGIPGMLNASSNISLAMYQLAINDEECKL